MKVLITGATGFVGRRLLARLCEFSDLSVRAAIRRPGSVAPAVESVVVEGLAAATDWRLALQSVEVVVNLAARVHVMIDREPDPLVAFRAVNVDGTLALAAQAAAAGVRRFVHLSSIKVNGEATQPGRPFTAEDVPAPQDPYGVSKLEAEIALRKLAAQTGMEVVIVRPPLVYGPGVKANFETMMRWVLRGVPLPLASIDNRRSLIALDNLVDFIVTCLGHPAAANQTFVVCDEADLSTSDLLRRLGTALGKPARLFPVPVALLELAAAAVGKRTIAQRLCQSLQIDSSKARQLLGWRPPLSTERGLQLAASEFQRSRTISAG
jgi:nucleoside-diphosphate-sugar epimerase